MAAGFAVSAVMNEVRESKSMKQVLMASVVVAAMASPCASGTPPPSAIAVRVEVTADPPLREALQPCLQRELNTEATTLTAEGPALTLSVLASEQRMSDGEMLGYLIYAGGYQPGPECASRVKGGELPTVIVQWQVLRMMPPDLEAACKRVASDFLTSVVEPTRRERERIKTLARPGGI